MDLVGELNRLAGIAVVDRIGAAGAANLWAGTTGLELVGALNAKAGLPVNGTSLELNGILKRLGFDLDGNGALVGAADGTTNLSNTLRMGGIQLSYWSTPDSPAVSIGNLLTVNQSSLETDTTGWSASGGTPTLARSTAQFLSGAASLSITSIATGSNQAATSSPGNAIGGSRPYTARAWIKGSVAGLAAFVQLSWRDNTGAAISSTDGSTVTTTTTTWQESVASGTAPATAAFVLVKIVFSSTTIGDVVFVDNIALHSTTQEIEFVAKIAPVYWVNPLSKAQGIWSKWDAAGNGQFSYYFLINATGNIAIGLGTLDGVAANSAFASSTVAVPFTPGQAGWIKATWRGSTNIVQFFTSTYGGNDEAGVTWSQLGADQGISHTYLYDGTQPLLLGSGSPGGTERLNGHIYYASIKNAIGGNTQISFDASTVAVRGDRTPSTYVSLGSNLLNANQATIETSAAGWGTSGSTVARSTLYKHSGNASLEVTVNATGTSADVTQTPDAAIYQAGQQYTVSGWFFMPPGMPPRDVRNVAQFYQWPGSGFISSLVGPTVTLQPGVWTFIQDTFTAPTNGNVMRYLPEGRNAGNQWLTGEKFYLDDLYIGPSQTLTATGTDWWWGTYSGTQRFTRSLRLPGTTGNYVATPDTAALSITGDIDMRVKVALDSWNTGAAQDLISKLVATGNQRSYVLQVSSSGALVFVWSADGISTNFQASGTLAYAPGTVKWLRAAFVAATGVTTFYDSNDNVTWNTITTAAAFGATSIFDSTAEVEVGGLVSSNRYLKGNVYYAEIRSGINGTAVAAFDPMRIRPTGPQTPTTVGNPGSSGGVWTINGSAWAWDAA